MKLRSVMSLVGLAIYFALPTFAQEKEDVKPFPFTPIPAGPQLVQQIEGINQKFDEAFNKHDAAAVGALYTANAVQMTPGGSFSGREAIEGYITDLFQRHNPSDRVALASTNLLCPQNQTSSWVTLLAFGRFLPSAKLVSFAMLASPMDTMDRSLPV